MTEREDIAALMPSVARALFGDPNKAMSSATDWRYRGKGSLSIDIAKGAWFDHEADEGGGVIDLIRRERKCSVRQAFEFLESLGEYVPPVREVGGAKPRDRSAFRDRALEIWRDARSIHGTLAERYLRRRGISVELPGNALRFHPRCPFGKGDDGKTIFHPAMIGLARSVVTGEPMGVHRTAINADGSKIGRMMLGPCDGAAIMLSDAPEADGKLHVCEGIETGLALMELGAPMMWALMSAGNIKRMPILHGIGKLTIWADNDIKENGSNPGLEAARDGGQRWVRAGIEAEIQKPRISGDFLDVLNQRGSGVVNGR